MTTYKRFTSNAGHSAYAPGASGCGYKEHEQNRLNNAVFIALMRKAGFSVTDTTSELTTKDLVLSDQIRRANNAGRSKDKLDISFHLNAGGGSGVEVWHYGPDTQQVAANISAAIAKASGLPNRGAKTSTNLRFLAETLSPAVLIEVCFIDNATDMKMLTTKRSSIMAAIAKALTGRDVESAVTASSGVVYTGNSIVDYLKSTGRDSSFSNRAKLAVSYGVVSIESHYHGTLAQNIALLKAMRGF